MNYSNSRLCFLSVVLIIVTNTEKPKSTKNFFSSLKHPQLTLVLDLHIAYLFRLLVLTEIDLFEAQREKVNLLLAVSGAN